MPENQPNLDSLFAAALEIKSAEERAAFLDQSCGEDQELRQQLEQLLQSDQQAGSFLDDPPAELEATFVPDASGEHLATSLDAGLAAAFGKNAAVAIGNANHSVLRSLGSTLGEVPSISLRDPQAEGDDPVARPKSPEMPDRDSGSRYQFQGEIARGGMGAILKGRDTDLGRDLAIKVLLGSHKDDPEVIRRFVEEAQIGGQLQHPGIAPVYELGQFGDKRPFFSMKLVKGDTLSKLLAAREEPTADRGKLLGIFEQICQTMAYAHSRGVIHRDLKPANIMVGAFGEVQVVDWGLAKVLNAGGLVDEKKSTQQQSEKTIVQTLRTGVGSVDSQTQMGSVMGTPAYMPPEQALGEVDQMDERADVFGLGAILCVILTGKPPYIGTEGTLVYRQASRGKLADCLARLDSCGADADLVALTKHCLEPEPKNRPRDASALAERVTGYLESVESKLRETEIRRAAESVRAVEARKRMRVTMALAASVVISLSVAGGGWMWLEQQAADRREIVTAKINSALNDAQVHQSLADSADLNAQVVELDKAVSFARSGAELAQQEAVAPSLRDRTKKLLADLKTSVASIRQISEQARKDHEFQEELELIRLSQADSATLNITVDAPISGADGVGDDGAGSLSDEQIFGRNSKPATIILFDVSTATDRYLKAFQNAGLDMRALDVAEAAAIVRSSAIRESQIAAIDNWARAMPRSELAARSTDGMPSQEQTASVDDARSVVSREKLLAIADAADDSQWRRTVRQALEANNTGLLSELAESDDARSQSPELTAWLGAALREGDKAEAAVGLLVPAQRKAPGDFWLNFELGKSLGKQGDHQEGLSFVRVAVGIRPESTGALMALANSSLGAERYDDAATAYHTVISRFPTFVEAHTGLAAVLLKQGQGVQALAVYEKAFELDSTNAVLHYNAGVVLESNGKLDDAVTKYLKAIELDPHTQFYSALAACYHALSSFRGPKLLDQTAAAYAKAIELNSPRQIVWDHLSRWRVLREQGKQGEAIDEIETAIRLNPQNYLAYLSLGEILLDQGKPDEAHAAISKVIEILPNSELGYHSLGEFFGRQNMHTKAITAYRKSIEVNPSYAWSYTGLGISLRRQGKLAEAIEMIEKGIERFPTSSHFYFELGYAHYERRNFKEAIVAFREACKIMPYSDTYDAQLMTALREQGGLEAVIAEHRDAIIRNPNLSVNHVRLGIDLCEQGSPNEAVAAFEKAIELDPQRSSVPYVQLASLFRGQEAGEASAAYRKVLEKYPDSSIAHEHFARSLATTPTEHGDYPNLDEAVRWARHACDLNPNDGSYWNTLGIALYRQGRWQESLDALERSQQQSLAELPSNWPFLTMSHWQLDDKQRALDAYTRAISSPDAARPDQELQHFITQMHTALGREGLEFMLSADSSSELAADALAELLTQQWALATWPAQSLRLGQDNEEEGINLVEGPADGITELATIGGQACRLVRENAKASYVYFNIDKPFKPNTSMDAVVEVEYWDDGSGNIGLHYDAHGDAYQQCPERINFGNTGTWKKTTFSLRKARLANSQHGQSDFRIRVSGGDLHLKRVALQRVHFFDETTEPWGKLATAYHLAGDDAALTNLLQNHPEAAAGIGDFHLLNKNWQQAIDVYDSLIDDDATNPQSLSNRARAFIALGKIEQAIADLKRAVNLSPTTNDAEILADLLTQEWIAKNWPEQSVKLGEQDEANGITLVDLPDGVTEVATIDGQECRLVRRSVKNHYAYFTINEKLKADVGVDAVVEVEYWDDGSGLFRLQYSTKSAAYSDSSERVSTGNTGQWRKARFILANAHFANSQQGKADFRIAVIRADLHVRRVSLQRVLPTGETIGPWEKLARAYHLTGDEAALAKLLQAHPEATAGIENLQQTK